MKQIFTLLLLIACFAHFSCSNDNQASAAPIEEKDKNSTAVEVKDLPKTANAVDDMNKKMEELKKLQPYTLDQLKNLLPQQVDGAKRKNYNAHSALGYAVIQADYKLNDSATLQIGVYDCAGEAGSSWYALNYWSKMSFQQEDENGYTKTVDFNGGKAVEGWNSQSKESTLSYVANDRLLIMLNGKNMTAEELKAKAGKLSFTL